MNPSPDTAPLHPFATLTPDAVLDALASVGLYGDGRLMALSSYENRVYQATLEDGSRVVAKFYRPGRWSEAQILEEHAFSQELADAEVPVVAPLLLHGAAGHADGHLDAPGCAQRVQLRQQLWRVPCSTARAQAATRPACRTGLPSAKCTWERRS